MNSVFFISFPLFHYSCYW